MGPRLARPHDRVLRCPVKDVLRAGDAPDHVADIVGHQQRSVGAQRDADGTSVGFLFVGREEAAQNIPRRPGGAAVLERDEHHLVAAQRAAIPGAVLADHHAVRKARQRAGRHPAQAERGGVAAERIVRLDRLCDQSGVLRHAVVHRLAPVAIGPAVKAAVAHRGQVVGRRFVADAVALVDHRPQHAGGGLRGKAHRVAQAAGKDAAGACGQVELVDRGAAFFDLHAHLGDVAERADAGIELPAISARQQAARPVPAGLERGQPAPGRGDAVGARRIREGHHAVGVADIEGVAEQRHAERLVQSLHEDALLLRDAVAINVAQQRDAVGAFAQRRRAPHRRLHGVAEHAGDARGHLRRLGDEDAAIGQHMDPARMFQAGGECVDLEPRRCHRPLPVAPSPGRRHLECRECALWLRRRHHRRAAPGRRGRGALQPPPLQRDAADQRHQAREQTGKIHVIPLLSARTLSDTAVR